MTFANSALLAPEASLMEGWGGVGGRGNFLPAMKISSCKPDLGDEDHDLATKWAIFSRFRKNKL